MKKVIVFILLLFPVLALCDTSSQRNYNHKVPALNNEFDNVHSLLQATVRTTGDQTIAGTKTFSGDVIIQGDISIASGTVSGTLQFTNSLPSGSTTQITNTIYQNNIINAWGSWSDTGSLDTHYELNMTLEKTGTGDYTIVWHTDFANGNAYAIFIQSDVQGSKVVSQNATGAHIQTLNSGGVAVNASILKVMAIGAQ